MIYNRTGRSGLKLPAISLGLWQNFGGVDVFENATAMIRAAFDRGITHFDLANNYGPPPGSAEETFGRILRRDFGSHRDEMVISTKAGYQMWDGPYGDGGSRKYLVSSLDQSLKRMGLDYVDIFYHHRPDAETPVEESMGALAQVVRQGKALYAGISNYTAEQTLEAAAILKDLGVPLLIHQPKYSMFHRLPEQGLLDALDTVGAGCIVFSPLAQGLLSDRYLTGIPEGSRISRPQPFLRREALTDEVQARIRRLNDVAADRGQSLAQMALAWVLRRQTVTSALIGASSVAQIEINVGALDNVSFTDEELRRIEGILS